MRICPQPTTKLDEPALSRCFSFFLFTSFCSLLLLMRQRKRAEASNRISSNYSPSLVLLPTWRNGLLSGRHICDCKEAQGSLISSQPTDLWISHPGIRSVQLSCSSLRSFFSLRCVLHSRPGDLVLHLFGIGNFCIPLCFIWKEIEKGRKTGMNVHRVDLSCSLWSLWDGGILKLQETGTMWWEQLELLVPLLKLEQLENNWNHAARDEIVG